MQEWRVLVAFDSPFKGMRGVVVGDFDSPGRAAHIQKCKQVKDDDGIMVTVQKERSNARFTLAIKKLVHVTARASTPLPPSRSPTPPPQASWMSNSRVLDGRAGYLALDQPFREEDLDKKMIRVWAVGPKRNQPPGFVDLVSGQCGTWRMEPQLAKS
ncbi:hypothetical protein B0H14DRAFT_2617037 [Mycena olivaceomarginata]|nr:hypothetical protein B0H14DRAFT_2617037 [Mycena olivaceomarginata]